MNKLLQDAVRACPLTEDIDVTFVEAGNLDLDAFYAGDRGLFRFHSGWLDIGSVIGKLDVSDGIMEADLVF